MVRFMCQICSLILAPLILLALDSLLAIVANGEEIQGSVPTVPRISGYFSCIGYLSANNLALGERRKNCGTYLKKKRAENNKDGTGLVVVASDGKFYEGTFSPFSYFESNKPLLVDIDTTKTNAWQHYCTEGYYHNFIVDITDARETQLPTDIKEIGLFLPAKDPAKHRVAVVTHKWVSGTTQFEDQMPSLSSSSSSSSSSSPSTVVEFIFVRISPHPQKDGYMQISLMHNSSSMIHQSQWIQVSTPAIEIVFDSIDIDALVIHFLPPWRELMHYFTTLNMPIAYIMHDHHLIASGPHFSSETHLSCGQTISFGMSHYKQKQAQIARSRRTLRNKSDNIGRSMHGTNESSFSDRMPNGVNIQHLGVFKTWDQWRWDAAELLRRCVAVVTPSARNKQIFSIFFPEIYVSSAPLVRPKTAVCEVPTVATPVVESEPLRIVVLGAVNIGNRAIIVEQVALEGYMTNKWIVYHVGSNFHYSSGKIDVHHINASAGAYKDKEEAMRIIDAINPHLIWFPAPRHESFSFELSIVLDSKYPVAASTTGSFPERLAGRSNTWLLDGCLQSKEWIKFFNIYRENPPNTMKVHSSQFQLPLDAGFTFHDHLYSGPPLTTTDSSSSSTGTKARPRCGAVSYDFYDMSQFFTSFRRFLDLYRSKITAVPAIRQSVISQLPDVLGTKRNDDEKEDEWIEFLALNPRAVVKNRGINKNIAKKQLLEAMNGGSDNNSSFVMTNRFSLDPVFFTDRNSKSIVMDKALGPPYTSSPGVNPHTISYNKLQWASPVSLLVVWNYLATNIDMYKEWGKLTFPNQQAVGAPSAAVKMISDRNSSPWAIPVNVRKHTRAAVMLDPRYSEALFAVTMNVMYHLGDGWSVYIYCSEDAAVKYRRDFKDFDVNIIEILDESLHSMFKVSKWLMDIDLWNQLKLAGIEHVLVYQADAILFTGHDVSVLSSVAPHVPSSSTGEAKSNPTSKWYRSVNQYIEAGFDFIGAYGPGVGEDNRTPKLVGINGGLSLRTVKAVIDCINRVSFDAVNEYRVKHGMHAVNHDPSKGIYMPEDIYYYHAMELLGYSLPDIDDQSHFAVQSAYHAPPANGHLLGDPSNDIYTGPLGIHGFDKGWYLTTAQLVSLMYRK